MKGAASRHPDAPTNERKSEADLCHLTNTVIEVCVALWLSEQSDAVMTRFGCLSLRRIIRLSNCSSTTNARGTLREATVQEVVVNRAFDGGTSVVGMMGRLCIDVVVAARLREHGSDSRCSRLARVKSERLIQILRTTRGWCEGRSDVGNRSRPTPSSAEILAIPVVARPRAIAYRQVPAAGSASDVVMPTQWITNVIMIF